MPNLAQKLLNTQVGDLARPAAIISLDPFATLRSAVDLLLANGISGCLVRSAGFGTSSNYSGMIDLIDIVAFFTRLYTEKFGKASPKGSNLSLWANNDDNKRNLSRLLEDFFKHTVADILTDTNLQLRYQQISPKTTIKECFTLLGPGFNQRLLVTDDVSSKIVNVITQTHLTRFVAQQLMNDDQLFKDSQPLLDLELSSVLIDRPDPTHPSGMMKVPLISAEPDQMFKITHDQLAIEAFFLMHSKKIGGVAVVHGVTGSLLGNISMRDFRVLVCVEGGFENLTATALHHLHLIQKERLSKTSRLYRRAQRLAEIQLDGAESLKTGEQNAAEDFENVAMISTLASLPKTLTVSSYDTIGYLLFTLANNRVRRCYLTSGKVLSSGRLVQLPTSILTLSDLMEILGGRASTLSF